MGLRGKLKSLEKALRGNLDSFELSDGTRYYFSLEETWETAFIHMTDCLRAQAEGVSFPEPPEICHAIARAKDRRGALEAIGGGRSALLLPYERDALVERGELIERSMVRGHELGEGPLLDRSE